MTRMRPHVPIILLAFCGIDAAASFSSDSEIGCFDLEPRSCLDGQVRQGYARISRICLGRVSIRHRDVRQTGQQGRNAIAITEITYEQSLGTADKQIAACVAQAREAHLADGEYCIQVRAARLELTVQWGGWLNRLSCRHRRCLFNLPCDYVDKCEEVLNACQAVNDVANDNTVAAAAQVTKFCSSAGGLLNGANIALTRYGTPLIGSLLAGPLKPCAVTGGAIAGIGYLAQKACEACNSYLEFSGCA